MKPWRHLRTFCSKLEFPNFSGQRKTLIATIVEKHQTSFRMDNEDL